MKQLRNGMIAAMFAISFLFGAPGRAHSLGGAG
jgi:hypothetical protein